MRKPATPLVCLPFVSLLAVSVAAYTLNYTVPAGSGCPVPSRLSTSVAINRQWSTSLPNAPQTIFTAAAPGTSQQITEIQQAILDAYSAWTGVSGTLVSATSFPGALGPLGQVSAAAACGSDQGATVTGQNTVCFNQPSAAFTTGVLAFTRTFTATAAGQTVGSVTSAFAGQILQADTLFRNDGQVTFATPGALAANPRSYDLESVLIHELGHFFGLEHSPLWRAMLAPFAPPAGAFWGPRPGGGAPDGPLRDDDRTGLRVLYPDPNDVVDTGVITGRAVPANPLSLVGIAQPAGGQYVTGIFGAHVVAVDAASGDVVAGALAGWSCPSAGGAPVFDGGYSIERLPLGRSYNLYIEPLDGVFTPADLGGNALNLCSTGNATPCLTPPVNTDFVAHVRPPP
ncbi:MAG TPA: matrixin family metalloprotease [Candidatus Acidoferrales bacterium]|nr:matrixin family metalloprotease [Candidatus Acidoferrales bacterium]